MGKAYIDYDLPGKADVEAYIAALEKFYEKFDLPRCLPGATNGQIVGGWQVRAGRELAVCWRAGRMFAVCWA